MVSGSGQPKVAAGQTPRAPGVQVLARGNRARVWWGAARGRQREVTTAEDEAGVLGKLLQRHRQAAGLSQEELAERAGLSRRGISDLERGVRRAPYPETMRRLAAALGLGQADQAALLAASRHSAVAVDQPAPKQHGSQLPVPLSSFVGRERELSDVRRLLGRTRLLTLSGPPGVGKTRLALVVAADRQDTFADGVGFVDLAPVADPALVPQAVASALGVHEQPSRPVLQTLVDVLRSKELLLVLDNCEHVVAACAELAETLLGAGPGLLILATSREVLRVAGETAWRVPSLGLPPLLPGVPSSPPGPSVSPLVEPVERSEAVRLFVARAAAALPGFALTEQNISTVAHVCHRLDGLPLAIELAAVRVSALGLEQLAALLSDRFRLLVRGSRTASPRQQTLRATVEWSYALLAEPERRLFERLAACAGGWTLEAAEAVGAGDGIEPTAVLELLTQLVDKSLVAAQEGLAGQTRYRLLETLREYAWQRLVGRGDAEASRERHAAFFLSLAERAEPELRGAEQRAWLAVLAQEHDNLRAALQWTLEREEAELGLRLAGAVWWFWWVRGHQSEGRRWLERLLALSGCGGATQPALRAKALNGAGVLAYDQGDYGRATALLDESLVLYRDLGDQRGTAWALHSLAFVPRDQGDYRRAGALLEESLVLFRELGDIAGTAWALHSLARVLRDQGDFTRAVGLYTESLALFRDVGDDGGIAWALSRLELALRPQGDFVRARALLDESLELFRDQNDRRGIAWSFLELGLVERDQGNYGRAAPLLKESLARYRDLGDKHGMAQLVGELAALACAQGQPERAARLFGAAHALFAAIGARLPPPEQAAHERSLAAARARLGDTAFAAVWAQGQAMAPEQAVAEAVQVAAAAPSHEEGGHRAGPQAPSSETHRKRLAGGLLTQHAV
jgi:predicted ATPase/transcriptional regulator with XRE-family HTH domain